MKYWGFKKWGVREDSNRRKGITHVKPLFWILAAIRLPSRTFLILHFESDLQKDSSKYQFSGNWVFEFLKIQIFEKITSSNGTVPYHWYRIDSPLKYFKIKNNSNFMAINFWIAFQNSWISWIWWSILAPYWWNFLDPYSLWISPCKYHYFCQFDKYKCQYFFV